MSSIIILFSMLFVSIVGIVALFSYQIMRVAHSEVGKKREDVFSDIIPVDMIKDKCIYLSKYFYRKCVHFIFIKGKNVYNKAGKHVSDKYIVFSDTMNGKGNVSKKGAASFFLKRVSEHKREMRSKVK